MCLDVCMCTIVVSIGDMAGADEFADSLPPWFHSTYRPGRSKDQDSTDGESRWKRAGLEWVDRDVRRAEAAEAEIDDSYIVRSFARLKTEDHEKVLGASVKDDGGKMERGDQASAGERACLGQDKNQEELESEAEQRGRHGSVALSCCWLRCSCNLAYAFSLASWWIALLLMEVSGLVISILMLSPNALTSYLAYVLLENANAGWS